MNHNHTHEAGADVLASSMRAGNMSYEIIRAADHKCDLPGDFQTERGDVILCDCGQLWKNGFLGIRKVRG